MRFCYPEKRTGSDEAGTSVEHSVWTDLIVVGALMSFGYLGARLGARLRLPAVTGFLVVGIACGPHGLGLLSENLMGTIAFAEPLALGVIVFLIGEQLTRRMLARHHWSFWVTALLNVVLSGALVAVVMRAIAPDDIAAGWLLAIIAISGAPATIMAIISEVQAKGRACDMLLGSAALDSIVTVVLFSAAAPFLLYSVNAQGTIGGALAHTGVQVGGALVLGVATGLGLAWLLKRVYREGELLALGLTAVLLVVAVAEAIGVSSLLAPLVAGITIATIEEFRGDRERIFRSLRTVEYPVYIIFFTLAGAHLQLSAAVSAGLLAGAYILARSLAKFLAGSVGALAGGYRLRQSLWVGLGMLPQAGVAVGLALSAAQMFPESGAVVNAVVLGSLVFFEITGPLFAKKAAVVTNELGATEDDEDLEGAACRSRTVLIPVSGDLPADRLVYTLDAVASELACLPTVVLAHVVLRDRPQSGPDEHGRAAARLAALASVVRERNCEVVTRVVSARTLDAGIVRIADEVGADIVAVGSPPRTRGMGTALSPFRTTRHRVIDALDIPVFVVPPAPTADGAASEGS